MQTRRIQLQHPQLELFHPQAELIDWHKLPRETQEKAKTLKLLREYARTRLPRPGVKAGNHE
jgi:hypothetical protein